MLDPSLNFHHLRYFWAVAREGNLTRAARRLRVSQSALSAQIRQLEGQLGEALFAREGRALRLSEAGRVALAYADDIFSAGAELVATLQGGRRREHVLRVGAVATLSRNFQESFVEPLLDQADVRLCLRSGGLDELLARLSAHALDLVLSNRAARPDDGRPFRCRRIARQEVSLVGRPRPGPFRFPDDVAGVALILPGPDSEVRAAFDALCQQLGARVRAFAEVDDMAMMRLLARDARAVALLPSVVVRDELRAGLLQEYCVVPGVYETFYAITVERQFPHPLLRPLLARDEGEILAMGPPAPAAPPGAGAAAPPGPAGAPAAGDGQAQGLARAAARRRALAAEGATEGGQAQGLARAAVRRAGGAGAVVGEGQAQGLARAKGASARAKGAARARDEGRAAGAPASRDDRARPAGAGAGGASERQTKARARPERAR